MVVSILSRTHGIFLSRGIVENPSKVNQPLFTEIPRNSVKDGLEAGGNPPHIFSRETTYITNTYT